MPSRLLLMIASSDDVTMAARWLRSALASEKSGPVSEAVEARELCAAKGTEGNRGPDSGALADSGNLRDSGASGDPGTFDPSPLSSCSSCPTPAMLVKSQREPRPPFLRCSERSKLRSQARAQGSPVRLCRIRATCRGDIFGPRAAFCARMIGAIVGDLPHVTRRVDRPARGPARVASTRGPHCEEVAR